MFVIRQLIQIITSLTVCQQLFLLFSNHFQVQIFNTFTTFLHIIVYLSEPSFDSSDRISRFPIYVNTYFKFFYFLFSDRDNKTPTALYSYIKCAILSVTCTKGLRETIHTNAIQNKSNNTLSPLLSTDPKIDEPYFRQLYISPWNI